MSAQRLSQEEEKQLVAEYKAGISVQALMKKYGFASKKSIYDKIKKYYPNEYKEIIASAQSERKTWSYELKVIDSEFDAYFLGLLLTDGYITREREVGIDLADEDCIQFLSQVIGKAYHSYDPPKSNSYVNGQLVQPKQKRHRLILSDKQLVEQLSRLGVVPRKTYTLQPPQLLPEEEKFIPYIIRGVIDGDGCITATTYGAPMFNIVSQSEDFIKWLENVLINKLYMQDIHFRQRDSGLYKIETAKQFNILKLITLCYDKPFGMSRKYTHLQKTFRDYNSDLLLQT